MRNFILSMIAIMAISGLSFAQTAQNWTLTDHDGNSHTLYDYLNDGKAVYLDFFEPECGPCMSWHMYHTFEDFYQLHGPDGDNTVMCFMINTWGHTGWDEITGDNGLQFDWSDGVSYPIITLPEGNAGNQIISNYDAWGTPTVQYICPDKSMEKIWELEQFLNGQWTVSDQGSLEGLEAWRTDECGIGTSVRRLRLKEELTVYPNPAQDIITISHSLVVEDLQIFNSLGQLVLSEENINQGKRTLDVSALGVGIYVLKAKTDNGIVSKKIQLIK